MRSTLGFHRVMRKLLVGASTVLVLGVAGVAFTASFTSFNATGFNASGHFNCAVPTNFTTNSTACVLGLDDQNNGALGCAITSPLNNIISFGSTVMGNTLDPMATMALTNAVNTSLSEAGLGGNINCSLTKVSATQYQLGPVGCEASAMTMGCGTLRITFNEIVRMFAGITPAEEDDQIVDFLGNQGTKAIVDAALRVVATISSSIGGARPSSTQVTRNGLIPIAGGMRYQSQSAGDGFDFPVGVWASFDRADFEDDTFGAQLDGTRHTFLAGVDFSPFESTTVGVAVGYGDIDIDTTFNSGNTEITGLTVAPYMGVFLSEHVGVDFDLAADFSIGYNDLGIDTTRIGGGATVTGSTDATMLFASGNLTAGQYFGPFYLSGYSGVLMARTEIEGFTESNGNVIGKIRSSFGQFNLGGEAAYSWDSFEPFANASYLFDINREQTPGLTDDPNSFLLGLGVRYYGDSLTGSVEYRKLVGRTKFSEDTISVRIRSDF